MTQGVLTKLSWVPSETDRLSVCIVSTESRSAVGGLATYARQLVRQLSPVCEVTTVALFDRELPGTMDYAGDRAGALHGHSVDGMATTILRPPPGARSLLRRLRHLTGRRRLRSLAATIYAAAYHRAFERAVPTKVDVVHYIGTGWELLGFAALKAARRRGAAFTVWPAVHPGTWGDSPLDIDLYSQADAVFCQSDHELEHLAKLGVARCRLVRGWLAPAVEPYGDGLRFRALHQLGSRPLILFIARKLRSKGFHVLCEAMPAVLAAIPEACLVAIGPDGDMPYPPVPTTAYLDLGLASESVKADALAACNVFCMPSAAESFGIVYVEAWSYGKPVIGGPAPAVRELIEGSRAGVFVDQQVRPLVAELTRLVTDHKLCLAFGNAGAQLVRDTFNWEKVRDLHVSVFRQHGLSSRVNSRSV